MRGHNRQAFTFCAFAFCESNQCKILFGSALEADHEKYELELILSLGVLAGADIKVAIALCIRFEQVLLGRSVSTLLVAQQLPNPLTKAASSSRLRRAMRVHASVRSWSRPEFGHIFAGHHS